MISSARRSSRSPSWWDSPRRRSARGRWTAVFSLVRVEQRVALGGGDHERRLDPDLVRDLQRGAGRAVPVPHGYAARLAAHLARCPPRRRRRSSCCSSSRAGCSSTRRPNALLATFAIFVGLLLWFRIIGIIMLVAAAWVAVAAKDDEVALLPQTEADRLAAEHAALLVAARVRLRTAREARKAPRRGTALVRRGPCGTCRGAGAGTGRGRRSPGTAKKQHPG